MTFQRARNDEQRQIRINQITTAMIELMEDLPFDKITMKKLGEKLSFTRNNLYQYVKSKNEVILLIIQQDFVEWANTLHDNLQPFKTPTLNAFCKVWVQAAVKYPRILHWFPLLGELIEKDVTLEKLIPFKKSYFKILEAVKKDIIKVLPKLDSAQAERLVYFHLRVFPHLFHLYNESSVQKEAIKQAGYPGPQGSFEEQAEIEMQIYVNGLYNTDLEINE
ncbi:hypothetical protein QUW37_02075 [Ligilactobacillus aviarius]|uniref:hypothetical protein n=1 Tax=Ligilactobacillus aviarius TaxID=1606 RepID=UPI0025A3C932|nr:hypothetical protein [Ligilactobacillus aviarius]MDM8278006.1 hypothetical protein [Ligilactobacillus aviarius]